MTSAAEHFKQIAPETSAITIDEELNNRILGTLTEINDNLISNNLAYLTKPASVSVIRQYALDMLLTN